jgi:uncharacterized protein (TIRG00374 family)
MLRGVLGQRAGVPLPLLLASMVLEKVVAAVSSVFLAGLAAAYIVLATRGSDHTVILLVLGCSTMVAAVVFLATHSRTHQWVGRQAHRWMPQRIFQVLDHLSGRLVAYREQRRLLQTNLLLNLAEHLLQFLALYLLARGLGIELDLLLFLAVSAVVMLARRTLGFLESWGLAETAMVVIYSMFGVARELSVALALSLWATSIIATLPGAYLLYRSGIGFLLAQAKRAPNSEPLPARV